MKEYAILNLVGKDRPGIVDAVATFLYERGANIEDSRMASMGGCFSIMSLFSCEKADLESISASLEKLKQMGFEVSLHEARDPEALPKPAELPLSIEITSMDHPGIVQKVVHILHVHDINIHALNTEVTSAPYTGSPLFHLVLEAGVPPDTSIASVKDRLTRLAEQENLDLIFGKVRD